MFGVVLSNPVRVGVGVGALHTSALCNQLPSAGRRLPIAYTFLAPFALSVPRLISLSLGECMIFRKFYFRILKKTF